ncbi:ribonuclease domain-containing protein [Actinocrispum sp. NPDC049592]|uniref:ribonuclease domain-containing protein n=1 Tax=Actinocrispum sp. NPDC049592 TaxID=3154835 RepID=UPI0034308B83
MSQVAQKKKNKNKARKRRHTAGGTPTPKPATVKDKPGPAPTLNKVKTEAQKLKDVLRVRAKQLNDQGTDALTTVFGRADNTTGPVRKELNFDATVLREYADGVKDDVGRLTANNYDKLSPKYKRALETLTTRIQDSQRYARDIAGLEAVARSVGDGVDPATNPMLSKPWKEIQRLKGVETRDGLAGQIAEVGLRLDMIKDVLSAINGVDQAVQVGRIPDDLLTAAGPDAEQQLRILHAMTKLEPDRAKVKKILDNADTKADVPELLKTAKDLDADLDKVLTACTKNTKTAEELLKLIKGTKKNAKYFTGEGSTVGTEDGRGGQRLQDLHTATVAKAVVWSGQEIAGSSVPYGTKDDPVDFATVKARTMDRALVGTQAPPGGWPGTHFVAGGIYDNVAGAGSMQLPKYNHGTRSAITYREYDVHPYTGADRGPERVVEGSDGSVYYTKDHYNSFKRIT